jgi:hypothetical protein
MWQKYLLPFVWFPITAVLLFLNLTLLANLSAKSHTVAANKDLTAKVSTSSFGSEQVLGATVQAGDARELLLYNFLAQNESPLAKYADYLVDRANAYNIDYRLVASIAMCESTGGKRIPSKDSFNAWGISVETGQTSGKNFNSWTHAIDWVSKYMAEKYYNRGITDLIDIGAIYAPPSVANGNSWATCVQYFMDEIQ